MEREERKKMQLSQPTRRIPRLVGALGWFGGNVVVTVDGKCETEIVEMMAEGEAHSSHQAVGQKVDRSEMLSATEVQRVVCMLLNMNSEVDRTVMGAQVEVDSQELARQTAEGCFENGVEGEQAWQLDREQAEVLVQ